MKKRKLDLPGTGPQPVLVPHDGDGDVPSHYLACHFVHTDIYFTLLVVMPACHALGRACLLPWWW